MSNWPPELPLSVIIPAHNEADSISQLLEDLLRKTPPPKEILVIDAGSTDQTANLASQYVPRVKIISVDRAYPGQARHIGVLAATQPFIAFIDCEMRVAPKSLFHLVQPLLSEKAPFSQGFLYLQMNNLPNLLYILLFWGKVTWHQEGICLKPPVACCAMTKALYQKVGPFPPYRASEDILFRKRIEASDTPVQEVPEAIFFWIPKVTLWKLFKKIRLYVRHNLIARLPVHWIEIPLMSLGVSVFLSALALLYVGIWGLLAFPLAFALNAVMRSYLKVARRWPLFRQAIKTQPQSISRLAIGLWAPILYITLDVAALLGVWDWILKDKLGLAPETFPTPTIQDAPRTFDS